MLTCGDTQFAQSAIVVDAECLSFCNDSGKEVAALLLTLRTHKQELNNACEILSSLRGNILRELDRESRILVGTKDSLATAVQLSEARLGYSRSSISAPSQDLPATGSTEFIEMCSIVIARCV